MKIETGIPLPPGRMSHLPLAELSVGDSFPVPRDKSKHNTVYQSVRYANKHGKLGTFICARVEGGTRVWKLT